MPRPTILVCNDDGIRSPGLRAAAEAVWGRGEIIVAAPKYQQTGSGRSLTARPGARLEPVVFRLHGRRVTAFQADCSPAMLVQHAMLVLFAKRKPSLVVSGINYGENTGSIITASGTVGAALEAASFGVPAIAASLQTEIKHHLTYGRVDWTAARHFTRLFATRLLRRPLPPGVAALNLNIPSSATRSTPWRLTRLSEQSYYAFELLDPSIKSRIGHGGVRINVDHGKLKKNSDIYALIRDKAVSVTPLTLDLTARAGINGRQMEPH